MSYNQNNPRGQNYVPFDAFQYPHPGGPNISRPLQNVPTKFLTPPPAQLSDRDYMAQWEQRIKNRVEKKRKRKPICISEARIEMQKLNSLLDDVKTYEKSLADKLSTVSEAEWNDALDKVNSKRNEIDQMMSKINDSYLKELQHSLAKRNAKRTRLKKQKIRKMEEKKQMLKDRQDAERKIDENLQKMKNELEKNKRSEEEKLEADIFLREVFRKKHDAKKCIAKLQALMKLRRARASSARGRGQRVSDAEAEAFNKNIEKLISMWNDQLVSYEKEETELRLKLKRTYGEDLKLNRLEDDTAQTIAAWKEAMFGSPDAMPQRSFHGDMREFIGVRNKWDAFISKEGSAIPAGWLLPGASAHSV